MCTLEVCGCVWWKGGGWYLLAQYFAVLLALQICFWNCLLWRHNMHVLIAFRRVSRRHFGARHVYKIGRSNLRIMRLPASSGGQQLHSTHNDNIFIRLRNAIRHQKQTSLLRRLPRYSLKINAARGVAAPRRVCCRQRSQPRVLCPAPSFAQEVGGQKCLQPNRKRRYFNLKKTSEYKGTSVNFHYWFTAFISQALGGDE